jgi:hypothetical protein
MADRLHQFGMAGLTDRRNQTLLRLAVRTAKAYLHQLVVFQRTVDFPYHRLAQPRIADNDNRFKGVPAPAQIAFLVLEEWHNFIQ